MGVALDSPFKVPRRPADGAVSADCCVGHRSKSAMAGGQLKPLFTTRDKQHLVRWQDLLTGPLPMSFHLLLPIRPHCHGSFHHGLPHRPSSILTKKTLWTAS